MCIAHVRCAKEAHAVEARMWTSKPDHSSDTAFVHGTFCYLILVVPGARLGSVSFAAL